MTTIADKFRLPCGTTLKNRLAKAAMTEQLANSDLMPNERHFRLYERWSRGGAGLIITGNVQVDRKHLEHPGNIVIDRKPGGPSMDLFRRFARSAQQDGARAIMQLSHAGRQTPILVNTRPLAPSAVKVDLPGNNFGEPRSMTSAQIDTVIGQFVQAAHVASEAGFSGVQVHSAHGYLLSSFLSPLTNHRADRYGGRLENRAKVLMTIVDRIRAELPEDFILSVKLNSSDFQKGGLTTEDSLQVAEWLEDSGVDLLEISGGSYEQPAMMDMEGMEKRYEEKKAESTKKREAYFLEFAEAVRARTNMPLMVTGGFRSRQGMNEALESGACDIIGIARPLCVKPEFPNQLLSGEVDAVKSYEKNLRIGPGILGPHSPLKIMKTLNGFAVMAFFYENIARIADGKEPVENMNILAAFIRGQKAMAKKARALK
ncbi:NADH:flavin oxidoreductase/NADH oxidase family protein [Parvularcula lutaonensis]|uniref:NADH:flavin oxidoreductase/NADH oxidase family protein n=1 Tax=Parvularcula lutaonensis TaxID=491923 RepID=A0ABV7MDK5_9PROT|nr:NADH:flavin oxidoreductase/NADH oxidase family protein [Parvularcula lutaonensis]GGY37226.1 NADH oxidase [Parvularcula lutaonensis]